MKCLCGQPRRDLVSHSTKKIAHYIASKFPNILPSCTAYQNFHGEKVLSGSVVEHISTQKTQGVSHITVSKALGWCWRQTLKQVSHQRRRAWEVEILGLLLLLLLLFYVCIMYAYNFTLQYGGCLSNASSSKNGLSVSKETNAPCQKILSPNIAVLKVVQKSFSVTLRYRREVCLTARNNDFAHNAPFVRQLFPLHGRRGRYRTTGIVCQYFVPPLPFGWWTNY